MQQKISKSALQKERQNLKLYGSVLPSLELKRAQLSIELKNSERLIKDFEQEIEYFIDESAKRFPMIGEYKVDKLKFVKIKELVVEQENIVGVKVPKLVALSFEIERYHLLSKQDWIESFINITKEIIEYNIKHKLLKERLAIIQKVLKKTTQKVNLFDKILIPETKANIKRIQIGLDEHQRSAVIRSKISKRKSLRARNDR